MRKFILFNKIYLCRKKTSTLIFKVNECDVFCRFFVQVSRVSDLSVFIKVWIIILFSFLSCKRHFLAACKLCFVYL